MVTIRVIGEPGPQGSKKHVGHGVMVESSKLVKPWREAVKWAAREALEPHGGLLGPVSVSITFSLKRPASAPKRRRWPDRKPDIDKLLRSTFDALTEAGVWEDDARVTHESAGKVFAGSGEPDALAVPGAIIRVWNTL